MNDSTHLTITRNCLDSAERLINTSAAYFAKLCARNGRIHTDLIDRHQRPLFDLVEAATNLAASRQLLQTTTNWQTIDTPAKRLTAALAQLHAAESIRSLIHMLSMREVSFGLSPASINHEIFGLSHFLQTQLNLFNWNQISDLLMQVKHPGESGLTAEQRDLQLTFRRFAREKVTPMAEEIHREDRDLPEPMLQDLAALGCFGLSIPARYGGFQDDGHPDHMAMVLVSDELSRASFGTAGSLITRPELLAKALLKGGSERQKQTWLPLIASGERQAAVAITEPDFGSDVAGLQTTARKVAGGWRLNGSKMWCTFAGRADLIMTLARTDPDLSKGHRGLTLFIVEKPVASGHSFTYSTNGGALNGRAIPTIGYRGMHSFALTYDEFFVPDANVIGEEAGLGQGFYMQMHGFSGSRLQTAARALGVMTAAFQETFTYAHERVVFGQPLIKYQLTRHKLVQMAMRIQAGRQLTYFAARELDAGRGADKAAMAKFFSGKAAEWVTREALQLHGGMGYAEEFPVSRHFVDARVLSIFEGAEEVLALRIIARALLQATI